MNLTNTHAAVTSREPSHSGRRVHPLPFDALRAELETKWRRVSIPVSTIPGDRNIQNIPAALRLTEAGFSVHICNAVMR